MGLFCTERFKTEFEKLKSKKSYRGLEAEIIDYFVGAELSDLISGTRLNGNNPNPYIKKRLEGSGGYRVYYLLITAKGDVYLMFVHPKTGPDGSENIRDDAKAAFYKEVLEAIENGGPFYTVKADTTNNSIVFEKKS